MRRAIVTTRWIAQQWQERAAQRTESLPTIREGLIAYALSQAAAERATARAWYTKCAAIRERAAEFLKTTHLGDIPMLCPDDENFSGTPVSSGPESAMSESTSAAQPLRLDDPLEDDRNTNW